MLGVAIVPVPRHYGNHCNQSTVNAPFVTLIFGLHMSRFFPKTDAVGEENGKTNRIERFNLTLRQRISRLVRKMLSFSKKIEAHIGAIWNFIRYYNAEIAPKLESTTYLSTTQLSTCLPEGNIERANFHGKLAENQRKWTKINTMELKNRR